MEKRQLQTSAWGPHIALAGPGWPPGPEPFALISGLAQGNSGMVFTVGDAQALSAPVQACLQLQAELWEPFSRCPGLPASQLDETALGCSRAGLLGRGGSASLVSLMPCARVQPRETSALSLPSPWASVFRGFGKWDSGASFSVSTQPERGGEELEMELEIELVISGQ